jgi:hypothetical protein
MNNKWRVWKKSIRPRARRLGEFKNMLECFEVHWRWKLKSQVVRTKD